MTPKASYIGKYEDKMNAWELPELEIDIVENVHTNRQKPLSAEYMTALDAGMEVFNVLCPLSGEAEGQFCPISLEEGEDGNLIVVKCLLKCAVYGDTPKPPPPKKQETVVKCRQSSGIPEQEVLVEGRFSYESLPEEVAMNAQEIELGWAVTSIEPGSFDQYVERLSIPGSVAVIEQYLANCNQNLRTIELEDGIQRIDNYAFESIESLSSIEIPDTVTSIGDVAFWRCGSLGSATIGRGVASIGEAAFSECGSLSSVTFKGKTLEQVQAMDNYPWGISDTSIIRAEL